jgi:predicted NUDIX family phosphoesterase
MAVEEKVLVVERKVVEDVGRFHGLMFDVELYLREIFVQGTPCFMNRSEVEENPDYKQLIPYVIMSYEGKYLNYVRGRRAGEKRLVGLRSIGIGGHINPVDDEVPLFDTDFREMYAAAVEREVAEEVNVEAGHSDRIAALLNDDSNRVGSVHLGIVHYWTLDSDKVSRREQMITQMDFKSIEELEEVRGSMETWSMLCLDGLREMTRGAESGVGSHQEKTE